MDLREAAQRGIEEASGMWRYRWPALIVAWAVGVAGWTYSLTLPDVYQAEAKVYVDTETVLAPLMNGLAVEMNTLEQINLMTRALLSRPHLQTVAESTGLDLRATTPERYEKLLTRLNLAITINGPLAGNLYRITYSDTDPDMSRKVVSSLLNSFMEDSLGENRSESVQAQQFIEYQIAQYEQRLVEAEERLAEFKKRNVGLMPGRDGDYYQRLQVTESEIRTITARKNQVELRLAELRRQLEGEEPAFGLAPSASYKDPNAGMNSSVDGAIANIERQINDLLLVYVEKHPDVVRARETLAQLREMRAAEIEEKLERSGGDTSAPAGGTGDGLVGNPVYQHMRIELSNAEVELADLRGQLADARASADYLKRMVDTIPEVEAELNRLNRDYGVVQAQYDTLLERLEQAKLADDMQEKTDLTTFRVIDPPRVPLQPTGPNRLPLIFLTLILAVGVGGGLSFLLSQNNPVFYSAEELNDFTKLPIYGVISRVEIGLEQSRADWFFAVGAACLLGLFVVVLVGYDTIGVAVRALQA